MRDALGVVRDAGRLLAQHWPALLVLSLLAAAVRSAAIWGAVEVSAFNAQLSQLLLVVAPLGVLVPFVGMLVVCRGSLPPRLLDVAVSVLLPFLAVYQASGLLDEDILRFRNSAAFDVFADSLDLTGPPPEAYASRLGVLSLQVALLVVLAAWVVRWALGRVERATELVGLALVGALVEVYYTYQLAGQTIVFRTEGVAWLRDRVALAWLEDGYGAVVDALGFLGRPIELVTGAVSGVLSSLDAVVVMPVAWMAVAAVVLGRRIEDPERKAEVAEERGGFVSSLLADVRARFKPLVDGLRLLASAGLVPMLVFSLALVVVSRVPVWTSIVTRELFGPVQTYSWIAFAPMERAAGLVIWLTLTAPLVAAAVAWLAARAPRGRRSPASPTTPAPG